MVRSCWYCQRVVFLAKCQFIITNLYNVTCSSQNTTSLVTSFCCRMCKVYSRGVEYVRLLRIFHCYWSFITVSTAILSHALIHNYNFKNQVSLIEYISYWCNKGLCCTQQSQVCFTASNMIIFLSHVVIHCWFLNYTQRCPLNQFSESAVNK